MKYFLPYDFVKRFLDIVFATLLFFFLSPLLTIVYFLIFMVDKKPVLFSQTRVGKKGRYFRIYKFRTMVYLKNSRFEGLVNENIKETLMLQII